MIKQSCLYLRGLTFGYSGSNIQNTQTWVDANMQEDTSTLTSIAIDGHASGYVCGFGNVFKNGGFVASYSFDINPDGGWLGNWRNSMVNDIVGVLRQFRIMLDMGVNYTHGKSTLIISDGASLNEQRENIDAWGQMINFLRTKRYDILPHLHTEIEAGAYGFDGQAHFFKQFSTVVLLLDSATKSMSTRMCNALAQAFKEGVSFVVIQDGVNRGAQNFNAIFNQIGIRTNKNTNIIATTRSKDRSINVYGEHIGWSGVEQFHYKEAVRACQGYWYTDTGAARPAELSGQPGTWIPFMCAEVDINDDVQAGSSFYFRDACCVDIGDGFTADFDVHVTPTKPDTWQTDLEAGSHSIKWDNDNTKSIRERSAVFCHVVGYGVPGSGQGGTPKTNPGFTVINSTTYTDSRSYNVYKIDKDTRQLIEIRKFDTSLGGAGAAAGIANATAMANYLNSITSAYWVLVTMFDEASQNHLAGGLPEAMYRIGASRRIFGKDFNYRAAYNCFGSPGVGEGNAINEMLKGEISSDPNATFDVGYNFDANGWPYTTGTESLSRNIIDIQEGTDHNTVMHMQYRKTVDNVDMDQTYGTKTNVVFRDDRFKKLPMVDEKDFVVSVEHPCENLPIVQSHDWVRVANVDGQSRVMFPYTDKTEYLITSVDTQGAPELCTTHLMMNWEMFDGVNTTTALNEAGADHLIQSGGNRSTPSSLYFETVGNGHIYQLYQRKYNIIDGIPTRDSNDWQMFWKWKGAGTQGHNITIEPGYEYIVFANDAHGVVELAERHFIVPARENLPKWPSNYYNVDFTNSTLFETNRAFSTNCWAPDSGNGGGNAGIMMIIRRPLYMSLSAEDRTGWQLVYNTQSTTIPNGSNYAQTMLDDYQYMVLCALNNGGFSTHHFNAWNKTFDNRQWTASSDAGIDAVSSARASWSKDRTKLITSNSKSLTANASKYLSGNYNISGLFQVYRRPILCWEPEDILGE